MYTPSGTCCHGFDRQRFSLCPYCNPPAYEQIASSPIASIGLYAGMISGDFAQVQYANGRLYYECGGRCTRPQKKSIPISRKAFDALSRQILACHIERWPSYDSLPPCGMSLPAVELTFQNGAALYWCNREIPDAAAWALVESMLGEALGISFRLQA